LYNKQFCQTVKLHIFLNIEEHNGVPHLQIGNMLCAFLQASMLPTFPAHHTFYNTRWTVYD